MAELRFDRSVSLALMAELMDGGRIHSLLERRAESPDALDVQLRHDQSGTRSWASLYLGLTSVLDLDERGGNFRLRAHATHRAQAGFDDSWLAWQTGAEVAHVWPEVGEYLDRILADGAVDARYLQREGIVHIALCSGRSADLGVVQREATVWFTSAAAQLGLVEPWRQPIWDAVKAAGRTDDWWPGVRDHGAQPRLGLEADMIGVDDQGRMLVVEAKPSNEVKGLAWGPAQVRLYAELFAALLDDNPDAGKSLRRMAEQRAELGLLDPSLRFAPQEELKVVPVLAIGAGPRSPVTFTRVAAVAHALDQSPPSNQRIEPLEVWFLDASGCPTTIWRPSHEPAPSTTSPMVVPLPRFVREATAGAIAWKEMTVTLADEQRNAGAYGAGQPRAICLPPQDREANLLPDARAVGLSRFSAAHIRWHGGADDAPSNHLLSSQIQCVNALAPFVDRPDELARIFGSVLPIGELLPFGGSPTGFEATDHVVFEWPGLADHLHEWGAGPPSRGAYVTSADAAIRYRTLRGATEMALIEWKYTERYPNGALSGGAASQATRYGRYRTAFDDPSGPIRHDLVSYEDLFYGPIYQLFRQVALAWRMEMAHELGADVVRVVYVAPASNDALWASLPNPKWLQLAGSGPRPLLSAWWSVLRWPDRFVWLDSATLTTASSPTSHEFKTRYGHLAPATTDTRPASGPPSGDDVSDSLDHLLTILRRVGGEGSVLESAINAGADRLAMLEPGIRTELVARATELAELARRFRADVLSHSAPFDPCT